MSIREFVQNYRRFRARAKEEVGTIEEEIIIQLFGLYLATEGRDEKPANPFADLMNMFYGLSQDPNADLNPDDDDNDDSAPPSYMPPFDPFDG